MEYGPAIDPSALDFILLYAGRAFLGILSLLIQAGFAALGAMVRRTILGGLLVGFGLSVLEPMSQVVLIVLGRLFDSPQLANLYQFATTYHLDNARSCPDVQVRRRIWDPRFTDHSDPVGSWASDARCRRVQASVCHLLTL